MRVKQKIIMVIAFLLILSIVVCVYAVQTNNQKHEEKPVNATEAASALEKATEEYIRPTEPPTEPVPSSFSKNKIDDFTEKVNAKLNDYEFNGTLLIAKGDEVICRITKGYSDLEKKTPLKATDKFEIGSITKQFTAAAVAKLAEENKLSLNDKVSKFFPDYKAGKDVTVEQLLTMTSGVPDYLNEVICELEEEERKADSKYSKEEFLKWLNSKKELAFKPGTLYAYSNTNYYMLGLIIEQVTGRAYEDYIMKEVLDPVFMSNTTLNMNDATCKGYLNSEGSQGIKVDSSYFFSAGEIVSTVDDMSKWLSAYKNNKVLSKDMTKKALSRNKAGYGYGYGFFVTDDYFYHTGNTELFYSFAAMTHKDDIKVIALSNINDVSIQEMGLILLEVTEDTFFPQNHKREDDKKKTDD